MGRRQIVAKGGGGFVVTCFGLYALYPLSLDLEPFLFKLLSRIPSTSSDVFQYVPDDSHSRTRVETVKPAISSSTTVDTTFQSEYENSGSGIICPPQPTVLLIRTFIVSFFPTFQVTSCE